MKAIILFSVLLTSHVITGAAFGADSAQGAPGSAGARRLLQQSAPACTAAGQFVADTSSSCTHYWQCTGSGQGYYMTCGAGTAFNNKCSCCDFPANFQCSGAVTPPPSTPAPTTKAPTPAPTIKAPSTTPTPAPTSGGNPCTASGQYIADTSSSCTHFWQCTGSGQGSYMSCGSGTAFNNKCSCCDLPSNFQCSTGTSAPGSTPTSTPTATTPAPTPAKTTPAPSGSGLISAYFTSADFAQFFLHMNDPACQHRNFYTYDAFVTAAGAFPGFGTSSSSPATNKQEIAAFMGQISHETTGGWATAPDGPYSWGLCFDEEPTSAPYCAASANYPCAPGLSYHGRGPVQLSWNYNYIPAGRAIGFDGLNSPGAVLTDPVIAWKTAIFFWMTPVGNKPSCHAVMTEGWTPSAADTAANRVPGFGVVTNIINGGLECGAGRPNTSGGPDRIGYFTRYAGILGVSTGSNLSCDNQQSF